MRCDVLRVAFAEEGLQLLDRCGQIGFDAVKSIPSDSEHSQAVGLKSIAAEINTGYGTPEPHNIISPDPAGRRAGLDLSRWVIDLPEQLLTEGLPFLTSLCEQACRDRCRGAFTRHCDGRTPVKLLSESDGYGLDAERVRI